MLRTTCLTRRITSLTVAAAIEETPPKPAFDRRYRVPKKIRLSETFNAVHEGNRYATLEHLLKKLSGYVGRRQVRMQNDLTQYLERFREVGMDWHDLKRLQPAARQRLLRKQLGMPEAALVVFNVALDKPVCGVLARSSAGVSSNSVCMRPGVEEHGWRCGADGHTDHVYFEGMPLAPRSGFALQRQQLGLASPDAEASPEPQPRRQRKAFVKKTVRDADRSLREEAHGFWHTGTSGIDTPASLATGPTQDTVAKEAEADGERVRAAEDADAERLLERAGVDGASAANLSPTQREILTSPELNFVIEGRLQFDRHPRVWNAPAQPTFVPIVMGYDFHVHPLDPRSRPQIVEAAPEWKLHAHVLQTKLWEMMEEYGIERSDQRFQLEPDDVPAADPALAHLSTVFATTDPDTGIEVQRRLLVSKPRDLAGGDTGARQETEVSVPWFTPAPPSQLDERGLPAHIPFAPTFAVRSVFRPYLPTRGVEDPKEIERALKRPLVDVSLLVHPESCVGFTQDNRAAVLREVLQVAGRMPYALPWTLYFRVDTAHRLRVDDGFVAKRDETLQRFERKLDPAGHVDRYVEAVDGRRDPVTGALSPDDQEELELFGHHNVPRSVEADAAEADRRTTTVETDPGRSPTKEADAAAEEAAAYESFLTGAKDWS